MQFLRRQSWFKLWLIGLGTSFLVMLVMLLLTAQDGFARTRVVQVSALFSLSFLYVFFLLDALHRLQRSQKVYKSMLVCICVVSFLIVLHAGLAFLGQLGGIQGLTYLPQGYLVAVLIGILALVLVVTAAALAVAAQPPKWARYLYRGRIIILLIVIYHLFNLGTHFQSQTDLIPRFVFMLGGLIIAIQIYSLNRLPVFVKFRLPPNVLGIVAVLFILISNLFYSQIVKTIQSLAVHSSPHSAITGHGLVDTNERFSVIPGYAGGLIEADTYTYFFRILNIEDSTAVTSASHKWTIKPFLLVADVALTNMQKYDLTEVDEGFEAQIKFNSSRIHVGFVIFQIEGFSPHYRSQYFYVDNFDFTPTQAAEGDTVTVTQADFESTEGLTVNVLSSQLTEGMSSLPTNSQVVMVHRESRELVLLQVQKNESDVQLKLAKKQDVQLGMYKLFVVSESVVKEFNLEVK